MLTHNAKLKNSGGRVPIDTKIYQRLVATPIYLSHPRPDISYSVSTVSQFMQACYEDRMEAVNKIMRYLKATPGKGPRFMKIDRRCVEAYTDSHWTGSIVDRKSTSG